MGDIRKVNPKCVNAGNPYHECIEECYMKIANGKPRRSSFKNSAGYQPSGNEIPKRVPAERRVNPKCPKASNPYHECGDHCSQKVGPPTVQRSLNRKESGSAVAAVEAPQTMSRRTSMEQSHRTKPTPVLDNAKDPALYTVAPHTTPLKTQSKVSEIEELEPEKNLPSSVLPFSGNLRSEEFSFGKGQVKSSNSSPASGAVTPMLGLSPDRRAIRESSFASITSSKDEEANAVSSKNPVANGGVSVYHNREMDRSSSSSSDEEDVVSVASETRVQVGKYRVRSSTSSILQSILTKHGDIAENCILESLSMRSYYLETVCSVVLDLQSISFMTVSDLKVKEMAAIVKDLETARINVAWLRTILDQVSEVSGFVSEHQAVKAAKVESDQGLELVRKEMEVRVGDLVKKEKEVEVLKIGVEETKQRLDELEAEAAQLEETVAALDSQIERFGFQALLQELL